MIKSLFFGISLFVIGDIALAQGEIEALRYSTFNLTGTARFNGMSGAFGAIGADLSVTSINPAGLAKFNKSEFAFSPGFNIYGTEASYNGTVSINQGIRPSVNQVGFVAVNQLEGDNFNLWRSFQFAVNYNKLNIFNQKSTISGINTNSILAVFAEQAYGVDPTDLPQALAFTSNLAYQAYAIDPDLSGGVGYTHQYQGVDTLRQTHDILRRGGMYETTFTFSGNYNDKVYLGGSIGIPKVNFTETTEHIENIYYDTSSALLDQFNYDLNIITSGLGLNAKIGVIMLPTSYLRIGLAAHSPTRFGLTDNWEAAATSYFKDNTVEAAVAPAGFYRYILTTPSRFTFSAAGIIAKRGIISADVEYLDYSNANLKSRRNGNYAFTNENAAVNRLYQSAINIRTGGELRINQLFLRAGYAFNGSPYGKDSEDVVNPAEKQSISLGTGYRNRQFFADMAISHSWWKEDYYLYDPVLVNAATLSNSITNVSFTVGFRY